MCSSSLMRLSLLPSRLSKCPRSSSRTSLLEVPTDPAYSLLFIASSDHCGSVAFKVFYQNRIQLHVSSRPLVFQFQVEVFKVPAQDRVQQRLHLLAFQLCLTMQMMEINGFFALFPDGKSGRVAAERSSNSSCRGRCALELRCHEGCSRRRAHGV